MRTTLGKLRRLIRETLLERSQFAIAPDGGDWSVGDQVPGGVLQDRSPTDEDADIDE